MEDELNGLEIEKKRREIQKLEEEITSLRRNNGRQARIAQFLPYVTALVLVLGFVTGIGTTIVTKTLEFKAQEKELEEQRRLFIKEKESKFYDRQTDLYFTLAKTAAAISAANDPVERDKHHKLFLEIYNGPLRIVDINNINVLGVADNFEAIYNKKPVDEQKLHESAMAISDACQTSFRVVWGIK